MVVTSDVRVRFNEAVTVDTSGGTPTLQLLMDEGTPR